MLNITEYPTPYDRKPFHGEIVRDAVDDLWLAVGDEDGLLHMVALPLCSYSEHWEDVGGVVVGSITGMTWCEECEQSPADYPSPRCQGCNAYRDHIEWL